MLIRPESRADTDTIYALTKAAFASTPYSDGREQDCVEALRRDGDLTLSLVAIENGEIVGHVAFSPVFFNDEPVNWLGLGPISVWPDRQKSGIGRALIEEGLSRLKADGVKGCVLIGDPAYYSRFGFVADGQLTYRDLESKYVQWISLSGDKPSGNLRYSPGLE